MKEKIKNVDQLAVAAIRSISIDVINKANSGHPGTALSAAPALFELYKDFIVSNPEEPNWINRDRLVLSCGHASALLYTMLHMCGFKVTLDDLKNFRQLNSITPGHPEVGLTPGVDASSGPLGQGIAEAVGMAMAETILASKYDQKLYNHYTYCICGDGCLEEGISQEAIQYAGFQKLNKLILIYDKNNVTLDGDLAQSSVENTKARFIADDWNVIEVDDGNNLNKIKQAILKAHDCINKPSLIITKTIIGYGSAFEGTSKVHGAPLGEEDGKYAKKMYGYNYPEFTIPQEVYNLFKDTFIKRGKKAYNDYQVSLNEMRKLDPHTYKKLMDFSTNNLDGYLNEQHLAMDEVAKEATRVSSQKVLNYYHNLLPNLVGGSADVAGSVKTSLKDGV
ncbi:MAG: transketolase, partial [Bacilli bacterium]